MYMQFSLMTANAGVETKKKSVVVGRNSTNAQKCNLSRLS